MKRNRTLEALIILRDKRPKTSEDFARLFWPDSGMHQRIYAAGQKGSRRGCGSLTGGSFLSKLQKSGLICKHFSWADPSSLREYGVASLTEAGREYIEAQRNHDGTQSRQQKDVGTCQIIEV